MVILNYTATVYEQKISTLESYATQLQSHLDNLQDYKNQLFEVWTQGSSADYLKLITDCIISCKTALDRVNGLRQIYQNVIDDMDKTNTVIDDTIEEAISIARSLGIDGAE